MIVTAVPMVVTFIAVGATGAAILMVDVVMLAGALVKFVCVNVKAPDVPPSVIF